MVIVAIIAVVLLAGGGRAHRLGDDRAARAAQREPRADRGLRLRRTPGATGARRARAAGAEALDQLASTLGDCRRPDAPGLREDEIQRELISAGFFNVGAAPVPRLSRARGDRCSRSLSSGSSHCSAPRPSCCSCSRLVGARRRLGRPEHRHSPPRAAAAADDRRRPAGADRPARRHARGRGCVHRARCGSPPSASTGPLGDEIRLTIQEQSARALDARGARELAQTLRHPSVRAFVRAMVQGDKLGVSIGMILRNQAVEIRAPAEGDDRGARSEGAGQDPVPARLPDLPGDVRDHPRAGDVPDRRHTEDVVAASGRRALSGEPSVRPPAGGEDEDRRRCRRRGRTRRLAGPRSGSRDVDRGHVAVGSRRRAEPTIRVCTIPTRRSDAELVRPGRRCPCLSLRNWLTTSARLRFGPRRLR